MGGFSACNLIGRDGFAEEVIASSYLDISLILQFSSGQPLFVNEKREKAVTVGYNLFFLLSLCTA